MLDHLYFTDDDKGSERFSNSLKDTQLCKTAPLVPKLCFHLSYQLLPPSCHTRHQLRLPDPWAVLLWGGKAGVTPAPQGPDPSLVGSLAGVHLPYLTPRVHQFSNFFPSLWGRYSIIIIWNKVIFYSEIWGALFRGHRAVFPESAKLHSIRGHEPFCSSWTILSLTSQLPSPYKASWAPGELWPMT